MVTEHKTPLVEVIFRVAGSDEIVICVFDGAGDTNNVLVGCVDTLLFENSIAILQSVVTQAQYVSGWQRVLLPGDASPFEKGVDGPAH